MQKFNEMETDLKERSAKWERHTAELKSQLKIEKDLANENVPPSECLFLSFFGVVASVKRTNVFYEGRDG